MIASGYIIGPNDSVDLQIVVNKLYADVSEGNVRYNIITRADISINCPGKNGNKQMNSYQSVYNVQGTFRTTNDKITSAVDSVLADIINYMTNASSVNSFIKQNTR